MVNDRLLHKKINYPFASTIRRTAMTKVFIPGLKKFVLESVLKRKRLDLGRSSRYPENESGDMNVYRDSSTRF